MYIHIIHSVKNTTKISITVCSILRYKIQRHVSASIGHHQVVGKNLLKTRHIRGGARSRLTWHNGDDTPQDWRKVCFYSGTNYKTIIKKTEYHCGERSVCLSLSLSLSVSLSLSLSHSLHVLFVCPHLPNDGWSGQPNHVVACNKRLTY
jgi:hypothetical protein